MTNYFSILALKNPWTVWKGKRYDTEMNSPGRKVPIMLLEKSAEIAPERVKRQCQSENNAELWMWLVMEVKSNAVKTNIAYKSGMLGPWIKGNCKWSKKEMARININILGISELKWTGMGKFNSDDHYIYYYGKKSFRRKGVAITVNKRVWNVVLEGNLKMTEWFLFISKANH